MKQWRIGLIILAAVAVPVIGNATTSAQRFVVSEPIYITARVLPTHTVIVNEQGIITEIISNTTEDVIPKVFVNESLKENERPLTPEIYEQYKDLVSPGESRIGTLYERESLLSLLGR